MPLRRLHARIGISEHIELDDEPEEIRTYGPRPSAPPMVPATDGRPARPVRTRQLVAAAVGADDGDDG